MAEADRKHVSIAGILFPALHGGEKIDYREYIRSAIAGILFPALHGGTISSNCYPALPNRLPGFFSRHFIEETHRWPRTISPMTLPGFFSRHFIEDRRVLGLAAGRDTPIAGILFPALHGGPNLDNIEEIYEELPGFFSRHFIEESATVTEQGSAIDCRDSFPGTSLRRKGSGISVLGCGYCRDSFPGTSLRRSDAPRGARPARIAGILFPALHGGDTTGDAQPIWLADIAGILFPALHGGLW